MCGIAGMLRLDGAPASAEVLAAMTRALAHRGPDGEGTMTDGPVGLGHRRLAIIDLSDAAKQPMTTADGRYTLSYNGEVYNFVELRRELEGLGRRFRSRSDAEVVLAAYAEWGEAAVERFNGMFALAVWDRERRRLFLARDRYGIKPLYTWCDGRTLLFASEIKALLRHPAVRPEVCRPALLQYFTFQNVFSDETLFEGVRMFPAGHRATATPGAGGLTPRAYWNFDFREPAVAADPAADEEELHRLFEQAVHRQLVADVPVGSYLSGGMDSGAIAAVASRALPHMVSVTGGFDLSSASGLELNFDERARAEALSYRFGTELYEVILKAGDMERCLKDLVWHLEDLRVGQCYPNFYVSRLAAKFMKVVLAGTGGDELFGGYPWRYYRTARSADFDAYVADYYVFWQRLVDNRIIHRLFQPEVWKEIKDLMTVDVFRGVLEGCGPAPETPEEYVHRSLHFECKTFLHGLLVVEDKLTMAHGLEMRVPFLDNDLVDFAMRLPVRSKLRDLDHVVRIDENEFRSKRDLHFGQTNDGKLILREMLKRYLPEDYVTGKKQGFSGPDASWFRGESMEYVKRLLFDPAARIYEFLQPDTVRELVTDHLEGRHNRRLFIWSLLCFEWWCQIYLGENATSPSWKLSVPVSTDA